MNKRAILIDARERAVTLVELSADWRAIPAALGCDIITAVRITDRIALYLDDEGLLKGDAHERGFFTLYGYPQVLAGPALLCAHDDEGDTTSSGLPSLAMVRRQIVWRTHAEAYNIQKELDKTNRARALAMEKEFGVPIIMAGDAADMIGDPADLEPQEG